LEKVEGVNGHCLARLLESVSAINAGDQKEVVQAVTIFVEEFDIVILDQLLVMLRLVSVMATGERREVIQAAIPLLKRLDSERSWSSRELLASTLQTVAQTVTGPGQQQAFSPLIERTSHSIASRPISILEAVSAIAAFRQDGQPIQAPILGLEEVDNASPYRLVAILQVVSASITDELVNRAAAEALRQRNLLFEPFQIERNLMGERWYEDAICLTISEQSLRNDPAAILIKLLEMTKDRGNRIPRLRITFSEEPGRGLGGQDEGGLTRHFITNVLKNLIEKAQKGVQGPLDLAMQDVGPWVIPAFPEASDRHSEVKTENLQQLLKVIGMLMGFCYENGKFQTGLLFHPDLFKAMAEILNADFEFDVTSEGFKKPLSEQPAVCDFYRLLHASENFKLKCLDLSTLELKNLSDSDLKLACYIAFPCQNYPRNLTSDGVLTTDVQVIRANFSHIQKACEDQVKTDPALHAAYWIARGVSVQVCSEGLGEAKLEAHRLQNRIQGIFSKEALLAHLQFNCSEQTKGFILQWIDEVTEEELKNFVLAISGSTSIGVRNLRVESPLAGDLENLPVFHTCFFSVDIPSYAHYDRLKSKLEQAISHGLAGTGFQMA
jgi:hypothetical protein